MTKRIAHFVASDAHGIDQRRPLLAKAYEHVAGEFGESTARLLFIENPRAVIEGGPITGMNQSRRSRLAFFLRGKFGAKKSRGKAAGLITQY